MQSLTRILLVDDSPADVQLIYELCRDESECSLDIRHVENMAEALKAVEQGKLDVILLDLTLPDSAPAETLLQAAQWARSIPVVVVTVLNDDCMSSHAVFSGVQDYLIKGQIDYHTLNRSIRYARDRLRGMQEKDRLVTELRDALNHIKRLQGLLPICAACKKIRDYRGYWEEVEQYVQAHSDASFTHSICPDCARRLYPELCVESPPARGKSCATEDKTVL